MIQERAINFNRVRIMRCGSCGHTLKFDCVRLENWEIGNEVCPGCGLDCWQSNPARPYFDENDPILNDAQVPLVYWYHSSLNPNWPDGFPDPAEQLTPHTIDLMGGKKEADDWVARQRNKALHLGTYGAAVHNIFRRAEDQGDAGEPFYLFRVRLHPNVVIRSGWQYEGFNWAGDVDRDDVCPRPVQVTRYLNETEDPGSFSLAVRPEAIAATQRVCVTELQVASEEIERLVARLESASKLPPRPERVIRGFPLPTSSPFDDEVRKILRGIDSCLPYPVEFGSMNGGISSLGYADWAQWVLSLREAVLNPSAVLTALDCSCIRKCG